MNDELIRMVFNHEKRIQALEALEYPRGWELIAETVLTASVASVTFTNLSTDYRNLAFVVRARTDRAAEFDSVRMQFNTDTGNNYDFVNTIAQGGAGATDSVARTAASIFWSVCEGANSRASNFSPSIGYVFDYTSATQEKWTLSSSSTFGDRSADGDLYKYESSGAWRNTNAITSILLLPNVGPNFVSGCQFTMYGIL